MKRSRTVFTALSLLLAILCLISCSAPALGGDAPEFEEGGNAPLPQGTPIPQPAPALKEDFSPDLIEGDRIKENPFVSTETEPVSTFSADVDTASYAYMRKLLKSGYTFDELAATAGRALRTEELVNYFDYACPAPADGALFGYKARVAPTPWNSDTSLLMLTLKTEESTVHSKNNLVFLIDVSGSMSSADKLPLLKKTFAHLTSQLDEDDCVSIVTYSGQEAVVLEGCKGSKKEIILNAVNSLRPSGSTNGEAGIKMAYQLAERYFIEDGNNRIFLASDGDLNVGISSEEELKDLISEKRDSGVFLSVLGFGTGNYRDQKMETLADNGNGVYYYIDGEEEAERVFGEKIFSSLYTVAKDVKLQLTFNPEIVTEYRLIGYENRLLNTEDFLDDTKDAGDLGAGHSVTVFYELKLSLSSENGSFGRLDVRYKKPDGEKSIEESFPLDGSLYTLSPDSDFVFAAAVAEWSLLLRNSAFKGSATKEHLAGILTELPKDDPAREQFISLTLLLLI
jgi:Ca-activated chloride channel family protein